MLPVATATRLGGVFLSTPSARRATEPVVLIDPDTGISIHALREEGDGSCYGGRVQCQMSIHALREEGDLPWCCPFR